MTPQQLLAQIKAGTLAPVYLFTGPEMYRRRVCRKMLVEKFLPAEIREDGFTRLDLEEVSLRDVLDDAGSLSLFASKRVILVTSAEAVLPKGAAKEDDNPGLLALKAYVRDPTPDVVLVFDAQRFTFEGDDKAKMDRLRRFYAAVPSVVEFFPYSPEEARKLAADLAQRAGLRISPPVLEGLMEALGNDAARLANEIEKLALYTGGHREITDNDIAAMAPDARAATIFALVGALGRGERANSLDLLEALVRDGEYLPLALTFLSTQFRMALTAKQEGLRSPQQLQGHFTRLGVGMWPSRAQQVMQTVGAFTTARLEQAITEIYRADKAFRNSPPDERLVMECLVLALTT